MNDYLCIGCTQRHKYIFGHPHFIPSKDKEPTSMWRNLPLTSLENQNTTDEGRLLWIKKSHETLLLLLSKMKIHSRPWIHTVFNYVQLLFNDNLFLNLPPLHLLILPPHPLIVIFRT